MDLSFLWKKEDFVWIVNEELSKKVGEKLIFIDFYNKFLYFLNGNVQFSTQIVQKMSAFLQ
ncbi:hypothetical protein MAQA_05638 [Listeria aquatica FSL S10-1188]|uniref:Uncharacterized protein n=1 Tax=Listeria aquatica FSL S10-1188 TaxID=1265818 RepID=W7B9S7_9LIST|nr:hypothetical protein MAQA_05638 [Listeria aquatica FSL S10-1188]